MTLCCFETQPQSQITNDLRPLNDSNANSAKLLSVATYKGLRDLWQNQFIRAQSNVNNVIVWSVSDWFRTSLRILHVSFREINAVVLLTEIDVDGYLNVLYAGL